MLTVHTDNLGLAHGHLHGAILLLTAWTLQCVLSPTGALEEPGLHLEATCCPSRPRTRTGDVCGLHGGRLDPSGLHVFPKNRKKKSLGDEVEQKDVSTQETSVLTNEILKPPKGLYVETIVTYREDFVPITEKILNYWKSWTGGRGPES